MTRAITNSMVPQSIMSMKGLCGIEAFTCEDDFITQGNSLNYAINKKTLPAVIRRIHTLRLRCKANDGQALNCTHVVQKLVETVKTTKQISLVKSALELGVLDLINDLNENLVIQHCLQSLEAE
ncbi:hypothetical protein SO802_008907 [Lithocarpus litseifolius]|uniref:Uncharacterized protein n=1 Tax=Lithocarpus litseifolius TaxID=425828 RepID=A0AAW2DDY5_9ROSI